MRRVGLTDGWTKARDKTGYQIRRGVKYTARGDRSERGGEEKEKGVG